MRERVITRKLESRTTTDVSQDHPRELQPYGTVVSVPLALDATVRGTSVVNLNQLLADTVDVARPVQEAPLASQWADLLTSCT